jgi:hypothetical protein
MPGISIPGDLEISDDRKSFVLTRGVPRLVQRINAGLQNPRGTWRWDLSKGFPWFTEEKMTSPIVQSAMRSFLLSFEEVRRIRSLVVTPVDDRGMVQVDYTIQAAAGSELSSSVVIAQ